MLRRMPSGGVEARSEFPVVPKAAPAVETVLRLTIQSMCLFRCQFGMIHIDLHVDFQMSLDIFQFVSKSSDHLDVLFQLCPC